MDSVKPGVAGIFLAALEKESDQERTAYLDHVCGSDGELRQRVERLLRAQPHLGDFLESQAAEFAAVVIPAPTESIGSVIGPYKLLQQIGEGGFGLVYMAEQEKPVRRTVALKIIKPGMDTSQVVARFESERQALALMDHPNIAKVLDAGATDSGHPYFVMELVKGVPITEFCDNNHLLPEDRLKLFIDVCHAIQHAHQKGVIHRDIKPTNVMVTLHDGVPVVQVIDFGVAKATVQTMTERTLFTAYGQMVGTPVYMSPEQAEMSSLDVDTRTDVYSLGVLLYELLTGTTPLELERLRKAGYGELQRMIREEEPPRPSTRLSSLKGSATILAGNRGLDVKRLVNLLSGDLDWIVMKALEKDRNRRYDTPGNFAEDVERYLRHEAIVARPASTAYKLKIFAERNRAAVMTAVVVVAAVLAGTALAAWQAVRATRAEAEALAALGETERARAAESDQRQRAEANEQKALEAAAAERQQRDLAKARFRMAREAVDQYHTRVSESPELRARGLEKLRTQLLEAATRFYDKFAHEESGDPDVQAERGLAFGRLANLDADIGHQTQAEQASQEALKILAQLAGQFPKEPRYKQELAQTHRQAGELDIRAGRFDKSSKAFHEAIDLQRQLVVAHPDEPEYQADLADTLTHLGRWSTKQRDAWKEGTTLARRLVAAHGEVRRYRIVLVTLLNNMGFFHQTFSQDTEAIRWLEEGLPLARGLANTFPDDLEARQCLFAVTTNLALSYQRTGHLDQADPLLQQSVALAQRSAAEHPLVPALQISVLTAYDRLGAFYREAKRTEVAEKTLEEGLALARQFISSHADDVALVEGKQKASVILNDLALIRSQTSQSDQAATLWKEALAFEKQAVEQSPGWLAVPTSLDTLYGNWIKFLRNTHQDDLAEAAVKDEVNYSLKLAEKHPDSESALSLLTLSLDRVLSEIKSPDERASLSRLLMEPREHALELLSRKIGPDHPDRVASAQKLAEAYLSAAAHQAWFGRDKDYAETCRRALELAKGSNDPTTLERVAKVSSLRAGGDTARLAAPLSLARRAVKLGNHHAYLPYFQMALGMCAFRSGHLTEADVALSAAMQTGKQIPQVWLPSAFYRAMSLFKQRKQDEARQLATEAASRMRKFTPPPKEQKGNFGHDDLIIWMAYKEARDLLKLESTATGSGQTVEK
jgi:eukaryotic-like serine/threonine-protein kinase